MIKNILLLISVSFNALLYFNIIDVGQYKNIVDKSIQTGKDIATSQEMKNLGNSISDKLKETYGDDYKQITADITKKLADNEKININDYKDKYPKLTEDDLQKIIDFSNQK